MGGFRWSRVLFEIALATFFFVLPQTAASNAGIDNRLFYFDGKQERSELVLSFVGEFRPYSLIILSRDRHHDPELGWITREKSLYRFRKSCFPRKIVAGIDKVSEEVYLRFEFGLPAAYCAQEKIVDQDRHLYIYMHFDEKAFTILTSYLRQQSEKREFYFEVID